MFVKSKHNIYIYIYINKIELMMQTPLFWNQFPRYYPLSKHKLRSWNNCSKISGRNDNHPIIIGRSRPSPPEAEVPVAVPRAAADALKLSA